MKFAQKFFAFGLLLAAGLMIAGCSETDTKKPATTPAKPATNDGSADKPADNASSSLKGDFQLVSLNVPNMV